MLRNGIWIGGTNLKKVFYRYSNESQILLIPRLQLLEFVAIPVLYYLGAFAYVLLEEAHYRNIR